MRRLVVMGVRGNSIVALALAAGTASSCATYSDRTEAARAELQRGDVAGGIEELNKFLKVRSSEQLPNKWKKDFPLVILERATMLQALGKFEMSARDYQVADKELELLDIARDSAGKIGQFIYSDSAPKYKTSPTEKLSLNAMNMCNYLARGDLSGARVEARRFTVMRDYLRDYDPEHEHGAFGSYLAGFVNERLGNAEEALRYYDEALQERDFASLREPISRLSKRSSYRGERIGDYLPDGTPAVSPPAPPAAPPATPTDELPPKMPGDPAGASPPVQKPSGQLGALVPRAPWAADASAPGEVLVVAKVGRVPFKIPRRIPIGAAIGIAGAFVTGDTTLLEYGMFKVVTFPDLVPSEALFDQAWMSIDGHEIEMEVATDLSGEIVREYEKIKPKIIGAALTRMIARAAAAEGARAAGQQAKEGGGIIGFLAAAAVEGTLVALDKPDTRSWTTLPARVLIGRTQVPPGAHKLVVTAFGPGGKERRTMSVDVPAGGYVVVDVTTLR